MQIKSRRIIAALLFTLTACTTPYQNMGIMGGVEQIKRNDDTYMIHVHLSGYTPQAYAADYGLLRAAELTLADGYKYFAVIGSEDLTTRSTVVLPGYTQTSMGGVASGLNGDAATFMGSANTTTMPPMAINATLPEIRIGIKMFMAKPKIAGMVFDAAVIKASLAPKYLHNRQ